MTRQRVFIDTFEDLPDASTEHISLAEDADAFIIAPATADFIGRAAQGLGGDIVATTLLAYRGPTLFCPAMNDKMWSNPLVQRNIETLAGVGYSILPPEEGHLACGSVGPGRLPETARLVSAIDDLLSTT